MISLHSACCIMYSTVQRVEALQHARDPLKVMAGVLCRYHKMSEDRKTGLQANWRVAGLASVRTSHSVSVDLGFLRVVCLCIPHCITFCSATKQNGGKRILTEMSLSDGGRGLTQMCKNCLRMEERVKLWTLSQCKIFRPSVWRDTRSSDSDTFQSERKKAFTEFHIDPWCATDTCPDYITLLHQSRWTPWSALLHLHWNATFLWAWPVLLLHLGSVFCWEKLHGFELVEGMWPFSKYECEQALKCWCMWEKLQAVLLPAEGHFHSRTKTLHSASPWSCLSHVSTKECSSCFWELSISRSSCFGPKLV